MWPAVYVCNQICLERVNESEVKTSAKTDTCSILTGITCCAGNFGIIMIEVQTSKFCNDCELVSQLIFDTGLNADFKIYIFVIGSWMLIK